MSGIERIAAERSRQIEQEGFTAERDDQYKADELSSAAWCYLGEAQMRNIKTIPPAEWPWDDSWWKPSPRGGGMITVSDAIRMLEKAGALIAAEIDRLERLGDGS